MQKRFLTPFFTRNNDDSLLIDGDKIGSVRVPKPSIDETRTPIHHCETAVDRAESPQPLINDTYFSAAFASNGMAGSQNCSENDGRTATLRNYSNCDNPSRPTTDKRRWSPWLACLLAICIFPVVKMLLEHTTPSPDLLQTISLTAIEPIKPATHTKPIEQIQVGERVTTGISAEMRELANQEIGELPAWDSHDINPDNWRRIELTLIRDDGSPMEIVLLRPVKWLHEFNIKTGGAVQLSLPEMRQEGLAKIERIDPCPTLSPGEGRVVTGTFASTVHEIVEISLKGVDKPILCTPEHPFYAVQQGRFTPAHDLVPGNLVQHLYGTALVERIVPRHGTFRVYNLEVHDEHVFRVAANGVLVHNTWPGPPMSSASSRVRWLLNEIRGEQNAIRNLRRQVDRGLATADDVNEITRAQARIDQLQQSLNMTLSNPN